MSDNSIINYTKNYVSINSSFWKTRTPKQKSFLILTLIISSILTILSFIYIYYYFDVCIIFGNLSLDATSDALKSFYSVMPKILSTLATLSICFFVYVFIFLIMDLIIFRSYKARTIVGIIRSGSKYIIFIASLLIILGIWGVDIAAIIASAGAAALIISLSVQTIVADFVSGIFIVFDGDFAVGDIVTYGSFKGTVRQIGLRITTIENRNNDLNYVANSSLSKVINHSRELSKVILKFSVGAKIPLSKVLEAIKVTSDYCQKNNADIHGIVNFQGINDMASNITYSVRFYCNENRSLQTQKYVYNKLKEEFDRLGFYK